MMIKGGGSGRCRRRWMEVGLQVDQHLLALLALKAVNVEEVMGGGSCGGG